MPFSTEELFPAGDSMWQLRVPTIADNEFEEHTTVTATVRPADAGTEGGPGYYAVGSPSSASVLVLDNDIPEMRVYVATTQVRINEGRSYSIGEIILEADERPHDRSLFVNLFTVGYRLKDASASAADVSFSFGETSMRLTETVSITEFIPGSDFTRVDGRWRLNYQLNNDFVRLRLTAEDDDQMEGDETLVLDLRPVRNSRISIISSLSAVILDGGEVTTPDTIITIVDNDFVTIALDPDEHPDNPEVDEGEEIVFELTRPGDTASELTVTVAIDEPRDADADRVLEDTAPFTKEVMFPANEPMTRLTVPTVDDAIAEANKTVTAVVLPLPPDSSVSPGDDEYYNASLTPASVVVLDDDTTQVTITAVGVVGPSGLVEVIEGRELVFELTRTGDLSSPLTAVVGIDEAGGDILADSVRSTEAVVFLPDMPTAQLAVPTPGSAGGRDEDFDFEPHTTVTVVVVAAAVAKEDPGYYVVRSPGSVSVLVRDNDVPRIDIYAASTQASASEGSSFRLRVIAKTLYDERPHVFDSRFSARHFALAYSSESRSARFREDFEPVNDVVEIFFSEFQRVSVDGGVTFFYRQVVEFPALVTIDRKDGIDIDLMEGDESLLLKLERSANLHPQIRRLSPGSRVTLTIEDNDFVTIATGLGMRVATDPDMRVATDPDTTLGVVAKGMSINFVLTRPAGDLASELPVTVITEVDGIAPSTFTQTVVFPAGMATAQLTVPAVNDEGMSTVTAVVIPPDPPETPPERTRSGKYYNAASTPASVLVLDDDTALVTITGGAGVGDSLPVEVTEGDEIVFELTRTGDPASSLTVSVAIEEPQDANRVLEETAPFEKTVVFPAGQSTTLLRVPTVNDDAYQQPTTVTAVVSPPDTVLGEPGHYYVRLLGSASVRVLDDGFPVMRIYIASTQTRLNEGHGVYQAGIVMDAEAPPPDRVFSLHFRA